MAIALFYALAALVVVGVIGVMTGRHIVHMAIQLLAALLGVAGLYVLLSAEFIAAAQLVIYVGGTLVLIIFGVMLTARTGTNVLRPGKFEAVIAALAGAALLVVLVIAITGTDTAAHYGMTIDGASPAPAEMVQPLGDALLGRYLLPFELASLLLLAVMLGAAYLARPMTARRS